jgi:hypothetical protein
MKLKLVLLGVLAGCASVPDISEVQRHNREVFSEVLRDPENVALNKMGCTYEQVQKTLNGVSQDAPFSELQKAWGTKSIPELNVMHGLSPYATTSELYRAVRIELKRAHTCEKKLEA